MDYIFHITREQLNALVAAAESWLDAFEPEDLEELRTQDQVDKVRSAIEVIERAVLYKPHGRALPHLRIVKHERSQE